MRKTRLLVSCLVLFACASGLVLFARPILPGGGGGGPDPDGFVGCPVPACMAPCVYPPPPQVVCKAPGGSVFVTSFACCCCGGSENSYKFLGS